MRAWVAQHRVQVRFRPVDGESPTVSDAARLLGVNVNQVIKSLIFQVGDAPVLVVACGLARVDDRALAQYLGAPRRQVYLMPAPAALALTGFAPGVMPPFAHRTPLRTVVDQAVLEQPLVYGGTGNPLVLLEIAPQELLRSTGATTGTFVRQANRGSA